MKTKQNELFKTAKTALKAVNQYINNECELLCKKHKCVYRYGIMDSSEFYLKENGEIFRNKETEKLLDYVYKVNVELEQIDFEPREVKS